MLKRVRERDRERQRQRETERERQRKRRQTDRQTDMSFGRSVFDKTYLSLVSYFDSRSSNYTYFNNFDVLNKVLK